MVLSQESQIWWKQHLQTFYVILKQFKVENVWIFVWKFETFEGRHLIIQYIQ